MAPTCICWVEPPAGSAEGALAPVKAGFALKPVAAQANVLCRATFEGPARLTVASWRPEQLDISSQEFQRKSGLLDGGLIVLAVVQQIVPAMMALINRQRNVLCSSPRG